MNTDKMSQLIINVVDFYRDVMENKTDPRVWNWPMMSSPFPTLIICLAYVHFSKSLGPKLMEKRKPFELRNILVVYNFFQFIFSTWLFYEVCQSGWFTGYSFTCQPVDYSNRPKALRMARAIWWYYFSKFPELFDTVFFILRKKNNQVTTLHVIHHGIMPFTSWIVVKFAPGGHVTFCCLLNTFVHIIMYLYYMIAAMGPNYQKYIWWKKYLTALQMAQFVATSIHDMQLFFIDCNFPKVLTFYTLFHGLMFLFLFSNFFKSSYLAKETRKINMPVGESRMKLNGESGNGVPQRVRHEESLNGCKVGYMDATRKGYIEDVSLANVKKRD